MDISVILFYNRDRGWLNEARQSYYQQDFTGTSELIEINKEQSTAKNLNEGFKQARGKYVKYLCDDDMLLPGCLQKLFDKAEETDADVVCAGALNHNLETNTTEQYFSTVPETVSMLAEQNTIHGGSTLFRLSAIKAVGYLDEDLHYGEEYDLYLRLGIARFKFVELHEVVYYYRIHKTMKSMQAVIADNDEYIRRRRAIMHTIQMKYIGYNITL